jgi:hypothetical protein
VADLLSHGGLKVELSPGEKSALEAGENYYGELQMEPDLGLSPGQREAQGM